MKTFFIEKWNQFKNWFFNTVILKIFGKQISSSVLIVDEDGVLPYTVTDTHVILTLNGGYKVQILKEHFNHLMEYNIIPDRPELLGSPSLAPKFVDVDAIEAHNNFENRENLRDITTVKQDDSYYDRKSLKKADTFIKDKVLEGKIIKKMVGSRTLTKDEIESALQEEHDDNVKEEIDGPPTIGTMSEETKKLLGGINNTEEYNPESGPRKRDWF